MIAQERKRLPLPRAPGGRHARPRPVDTSLRILAPEVAVQEHRGPLDVVHGDRQPDATLYRVEAALVLYLGLLLRKRDAAEGDVGMTGWCQQAHFFPFLLLALAIRAADSLLLPCLRSASYMGQSFTCLPGIAYLLRVQRQLQFLADRFTHCGLDPLHDGPVEGDHDGHRPALFCRGKFDFLLAKQGDAALAVLRMQVHGLASTAARRDRTSASNSMSKSSRVDVMGEPSSLATYWTAVPTKRPGPRECSRLSPSEVEGSSIPGGTVAAAPRCSRQLRSIALFCSTISLLQGRGGSLFTKPPPSLLERRQHLRGGAPAPPN